jgi:hypothetical protein
MLFPPSYNCHSYLPLSLRDHSVRRRKASARVQPEGEAISNFGLIHKWRLPRLRAVTHFGVQARRPDEIGAKQSVPVPLENNIVKKFTWMSFQRKLKSRNNLTL